MKIQTHRIHTGMGKSSHWVDIGITQQQNDILNDIGYGTNKNYGSDSVGFENFLNTIDPQIVYKVECIQRDNGDYSATFFVVQVILTDSKNNETIEMEDYAENIIPLLEKRVSEKIKVRISTKEKSVTQEKMIEKRVEDEAEKTREYQLLLEKIELEKKLKEIVGQLSNM